jgi:adenosylcobinamide-GDP ribazoletransferase
MLRELYQGLKLAFGYFSILPVRFHAQEQASYRFMLFFFPLVGFVVAMIAVGIYELLGSSWYGALVSSVAYMLLYGFLHTEAICDVTDALFASHGGKDPYRVIKESTVGSMGMLYTVAFVLLKIATLCYLFLEGLYLYIIAIAVVSRLAVVYQVYFCDFQSTFVNLLKQEIGIGAIKIVSAFSLMLLFVLIGIDTIWIAVLIIMVTFLGTSYLQSRLGFLNGDTLGASLEINELMALFVVVSLC